MANAVYPNAVTGLMTGLIDLDTAVVKAALVRGYTYSSSHTFVSDVTGAGGTLNGTSAALANVTVTAGVFDADDTSVSTTASASNHNVLLFQSSAVGGGADVASSSQRVIAYFDTASDSSLPIQPGTGTVNITFSNGTNKIIKIG